MAKKDKYSSLRRSQAMHHYLERSNNFKAHRLGNTKAGDRASIVAGYHSLLYTYQSAEGRVFSKNEKQKIFKERFDFARKHGWYKD